ncbi:PadR family transcriptional regulator [Pradoshia sp.]
MEKRLKGLKRAMESTSMRNLNFTDAMKKSIHESIAKESISEQDAFMNLLELLVTERTGFELSRLLTARGIHKYETEEGSLYALLHEQEQAGMIASSWGPSGEKYYYLTDKGRRALEKTSKRTWRSRLSFKEQPEG